MLVWPVLDHRQTVMRVTTLLILATTVTATVASDADWWQSALIYQIYPRSFRDSNGDGIGDLNGITEKLPYLQQLGVDAIWLSPIFLSPMYDFGYDITDYTKIAPEYGTMDDFDNLMTKAKSLGIRVILDYVPNHTGNESEWFIKSAQRDVEYENYYIWADGVPDPDNASVILPPNNWVSNFRKSAWEYSTTRGQFYLHQFAIGQPDLNYREAKVQQAMKDVLRFWLDKGVSGFRVDAINMMYEVDSAQFGGAYPDEPPSGAEGATPDDYEYLSHIYTRDLDETYYVVYDWRDLLDEYFKKDGEYKIMMTEAYTEITKMIRFYGTETRNGSIPFNFSFLGEINNGSNARDIKMVIDKWMTYMPSGKTANWVNGNHDQSRLASRLGTARVDAMNMLALILPGVALTYQGEEIGMTDGEVSWEQTKDPQACNTDDPVNYWKKSRDPNRTPYHWDASAHAGFSSTTGETWLPVASNYLTLNLAAQMAAEKSHYKFYKDVLTVKKLPAVRFGDLETTAFSESVLVVSRLLPGVPGVVGIVNLSDKEHHLDLTSIKLLPVQLRVVASGINCTHKKDEWMRKSNITVSAHCALLLQTVRRCC
ncbi:maltase 2 [Amyelois transitella]|uniref:maltase 2 n=1 Tax=Amyelois transitella TaxID=680683 RepID=UPI0029907204|nr:maltase 2 [Amyelois transitella]